MPRRLLLPLILLALAGRPEAQAQFPEIGSIADSSAVVVTGRVASVTVQPDAGSIYTYATVAVDEVLKGQLADSTVVVKQLGGTLPTLGLYIADQAAFRVDEDVLLFLAARPRDGTLYTVGLSRGKWDILPDLQTGGRSAVSGPSASISTTRCAPLSAIPARSSIPSASRLRNCSRPRPASRSSRRVKVVQPAGTRPTMGFTSRWTTRTFPVGCRAAATRS